MSSPRLLAGLSAIVILAGTASPLPAQEVKEDAALAVGRAIEKAFAEGTLEAADAHFNADAMLDLTLAGVNATDAQKKGFRAGAKKGLRLSAILRQVESKFDTFTLLRFRADGARPRLLFRSLGDGGVNYMELLVAPAGTSVKVVDIYSYFTGEPMSRTFRRLFVNAMAQQPGFLDRLMKKENEYVKNLPKIQAITRQINAGQPAEALKAIAALPALLRSDKTLLVLRLQAAAQVGEKECMAALEDFRKACPDDPALDFLSIDALFLARRFDEVRKAVDRLDKRLGGDPYLEVFRANSHIEEGEFEKAKTHARAAIEKDETLLDPYWTMITISLREKLYGETAAWLTRIEAAGVELADLTTVPDYAGFVKSPAYAKWKKSRAKEEEK